MSKKRYMILVVSLLVTMVAVLGTLALYYYRTETTGYNLANDTNLGQYINYENGTPIISSDNAVLNPGSDYISGLSTEIEFWKTQIAHNMVLYGHVYLDIDTGSSNLLSEPGLKWTIVSDNEVLGSGNFVGYDQGDSVPILVNEELSDTQTYYQIYIWLDENNITNDISGESFSVTVRCEASSEQYSESYIERINADVINIDYTGNIDEYVVPRNGTYKLELWGAQGGNALNDTYHGGYGGYSSATINLTRGEILYVIVGGQGLTGTEKVSATSKGGYNGGGSSYGTTNKYVGSGGGASHIATKSGLLSSLESSTSSILLVAGGGGGAGYQSDTLYGYGGNGGGYTGGNGTTSNSSITVGNGGSVDNPGTGYITGSFGQGANATSDSIGGGGGYYGGGAGRNYAGSGGGSGYIKSDLTDGKMYCFGCTEDTTNKTYESAGMSEDAVSNSAKIGNGYARITRLS